MFYMQSNIDVDIETMIKGIRKGESIGRVGKTKFEQDYNRFAEEKKFNHTSAVNICDYVYEVLGRAVEEMLKCETFLRQSAGDYTGLGSEQLSEESLGQMRELREMALGGIRSALDEMRDIMVHAESTVKNLK